MFFLKHFGRLLPWLLLMLWAGTAWAQGPEVPTVVVPRLEGPMSVDGRLDEPQWQQALHITDYHPFEPIETGNVPDPTDAYVFFDSKNIYFGFRCHVSDPRTMRAHITPREQVDEDDQVGIYLDTYHDGRQGFIFYLNALGIQQDIRITEGVGGSMSWDTVFRSKGKLDDKGYVVEVAMPFRSLRFPRSEQQAWGLILTRKFAGQGVKVVWPKVTREKNGMFPQAAVLTGLNGIVSSRNIEVQPTLVTQWGSSSSAAEERLQAPLSLNLGDALSISPGLNLKYGLTSNLTLDFTFNPDFSQIESDPSQLDVNLRYALYYTERRPFFLEGVETFDATGNTLYTRSLVSPLWGLKLTGKEGPYTLGLLTAYDTAPSPSVTSSTGVIAPGFREEDLVDAEGHRRGAQVSVFRVSRDVGEAGTLAAIVSDKEVLDPDTLTGHGYNRVGGFDGSFRLTDKDRLGIQFLYSDTGLRQNGAAPREEDTLQGVSYVMGWNHSSRKLNYTLNQGFSSPGFRWESAYIPWTGFTYVEQYLQYMFEPKIKNVVNLKPYLWSAGYYDVLEDAVDTLQASPGLNARFARQNYLHLALPYTQERWDGQAFDMLNLELWWQTDAWKAVRGRIGYFEGQQIYYDNATLGYAFTPLLELTVKPLPWVFITGDWTYQIFLDGTRPLPAYLLDLARGEPTVSQRYRQSIFRGNLNLNLNQAWSLRGIVQWDGYHAQGEDSSSLSLNALAAYVPYPGTAAYLGVSHGLSGAGAGSGLTPGDWRLFFKFSYLWRV